MEINADYVRGFADADGGISGHVVSLHNTDLELMGRIAEFLEYLGLDFMVTYKQPKGCLKCATLQITGLRNLLIYHDKIGFCMERKQEKLKERIKYLCRKGRPYNIEEYKLYLRMKEEGASYRTMAKALGLSPSAVDRREKRGVWPLGDELQGMIKKAVY